MTAVAMQCGAVSAEKLDYGRDIRPILAENCFHRHGQDSKNRMAGLRLDSMEGADIENSGMNQWSGYKISG